MHQPTSTSICCRSKRATVPTWRRIPQTRNQEAQPLREQHGKHLVTHEQRRMHPNPPGGPGAQPDRHGEPPEGRSGAAWAKDSFPPSPHSLGVLRNVQPFDPFSPHRIGAVRQRLRPQKSINNRPNGRKRFQEPGDEMTVMATNSEKPRRKTRRCTT